MLTSKERQITLCVIRGMSDEQIAREVLTSKWTVRKCLSSLYDRFEVKNRTELTSYAIRNNLIPSPVNQGA